MRTSQPTTGDSRRYRFGLRNASASAESEVYESIDIFDGLSGRERRKLQQLFSVVEMGPGALVGSQGAACREFAVIVSGSVAVSVDGQPLAVLDEGCHFGELGLLDRSDRRRRASVVTLEPTRLGVANRREFATLLDCFPLVAERVVAMAQQRSSYIRGVRDGVASIIASDVRFPAHLVDVAPERLAV